MKKTRMTAYLPIIILSIVGSVLALISAYFFWRDGYEPLSIGHFAGVFSIPILSSIFVFPNKIVIIEDNIVVVNFPFFATNSFYFGKSGLIKWNTWIVISEIENVELVSLSVKERKEYYGTYTVFDQFLKIDMKGSSRSKFIYIAIYSKRQMDQLIEIINSRKSEQSPLNSDNNGANE